MRTGGPPHGTIADEFPPDFQASNEPGTLSMANTGRPNSGEFAPSAEKIIPDFGRYRGLVSGAQAVGTVWRDARLGLAYARLSSEADGQRGESRRVLLLL